MARGMVARKARGEMPPGWERATGRGEMRIRDKGIRVLGGLGDLKRNCFLGWRRMDRPRRRRMASKGLSWPWLRME